MVGVFCWAAVYKVECCHAQGGQVVVRPLWYALGGANVSDGRADLSSTLDVCQAVSMCLHVHVPLSIDALALHPSPVGEMWSTYWIRSGWTMTV